MKNSSRWRIGALASAVALLCSLASLQAQALTLGRMTVQSALGEPLRAEIDIVEINAEEAATLKAVVAPPDAFKAAGLDYNAVAAAGLELRLERRPNGRAYLRVLSSRPITGAFVDLIIEASWASGRISRDYTMLLDPPNLGSRTVPVEPSAALLSKAPLAAPPAAPTVGPGALSSSSPPVTALRPAPAIKSPAPERLSIGARQVTVKSGDTAGEIAGLSKPSNVSLDQMLVALLRSNPAAFIDGNVNRIKSGAVLDIPGAESANAVSAGEARQTIAAQSKDFNAFRRKLAGSAPTTQINTADRQTGGKVQAKVEDRAAASAAPDKLTLSKGQLQGKAGSANEEKIARAKETKAADSRIAELSKNIAELNKLNTAPGAGSSAGQPPVTAAIVAPAPSGLARPAIAPETPQKAPVANTPVASASDTIAGEVAKTATATTAASQPAAAASVAAPAAVKKPVLSATPSAPEPGMLDQLLENPLLLPGVTALLALLAALGLYRYRTNKKKAQIDSSFFESRATPDSFFGASGGQRIDTSERSGTASSMAYTHSQLDAAGDVDPVAEADVYLAYGRDFQAEEILNEALRLHPARVAIYAKLLEIYAKRQDVKAFESMAVDAFELTQGFGPEWAYIAATGQQLDPANPMYQANGTPTANARSQEAPLNVNGPMAGDALASSLRTVDLDLDFSLDDQPELTTMPGAISVSSPYGQTSAGQSQLPKSALPASPNDLDLDLDLDLDVDRATAALPGVSGPAHPLMSEAPDAPDFDFMPDSMNFASESFPQPSPRTKGKVEPAGLADNHMLEFDMNSLSLDLDPEPTTQTPGLAAAEGAEDPLEIKFLLAEEFRALGDSEGARSLADEVVAKAGNPLKAKAQAFLNALP